MLNANGIQVENQEGQYDLDGVEPVYLDHFEKKQAAEYLQKILADSTMLYLKTYNFHWNVASPMFKTLHDMFAFQYKELSEAIDKIAERIRELGYSAPSTFSEISILSSISEDLGSLTPIRMVELLINGQEQVIKEIREILPELYKCHDEATIDLLLERMQVHEKIAWKLRSILG